MTDGNDEIIRTSSGNNGVNDAFHISSFIEIVSPFMKEFLDDISKIGRQCLAHL